MDFWWFWSTKSAEIFIEKLPGCAAVSAGTAACCARLCASADAWLILLRKTSKDMAIPCKSFQVSERLPEYSGFQSRERERCPEMPGENLGVSCACAVRTVILAVASCPRFGCVPWDAVSIVLLRGGQMLSGSSMFFMCLESSSTFQHDWHMQADMRACMFG